MDHKSIRIPRVVSTLRLGLASSAALLLGACGQPPVVLMQPTSVTEDGSEYVYFIEQEQNKSSRIKRCSLGKDNKASCSVEYEPK